jgi:hypothetical protein
MSLPHTKSGDLCAVLISRKSGRRMFSCATHYPPLVCDSDAHFTPSFCFIACDVGHRAVCVRAQDYSFEVDFANARVNIDTDAPRLGSQAQQIQQDVACKVS